MTTEELNQLTSMLQLHVGRTDNTPAMTLEEWTVYQASIALLAKLVPSCIHAALQAQAKGQLEAEQLDAYTYHVAVDTLARSLITESADMLAQMAKDDPEVEVGPEDIAESACQWVEESDLVDDIQTRIGELSQENSGASA